MDGDLTNITAPKVNGALPSMEQRISQKTSSVVWKIFFGTEEQKKKVIVSCTI
jgi:hypothetical protein